MYKSSENNFLFKFTQSKERSARLDTVPVNPVVYQMQQIHSSKAGVPTPCETVCETIIIEASVDKILTTLLSLLAVQYRMELVVVISD